MTWRSKAACISEDPELFFPIGKSAPAYAQAIRAKEVCKSCAVLNLCLEWALKNGQDCGVWGGTTEEERRRLRKQGMLHDSKYAIRCPGSPG
ncbi:WhiB family transcriptional regulator [Actinomycetaceae bacterium TAE3-ERU4]|nr:WhiB family transcriptional regulator [Actinomycetaceae bacterium TAE3-ERU4]